MQSKRHNGHGYDKNARDGAFADRHGRVIHYADGKLLIQLNQSREIPAFSHFSRTPSGQMDA